MTTTHLSAISICLLIAFTNARAIADPNEQKDGWFCEQGKQNKEWVCIQSEPIEADTATASVDAPDTLVPEKRDVLPIKELLENTTAIPEPALAPDPAALPVADPEPVTQVNTNLPLYLQLAYKPGQAITISELPPEFYVVQLLSMSNKSNLEAYFGKQKLVGLSAARVESNREILYVLLLGIYENLANANQAVENIPAQLNDLEPWVRRLGSLQRAMIRADDLTGSKDY